MDRRHVQRLPSRFAGPRVADDRGDGRTGIQELLDYQREAVNVLCDRPEDVLRHGLGAAVQAPVWHALGLEPFDVVSECSEHRGDIASPECAIDALDELDVLVTHVY